MLFQVDMTDYPFDVQSCSLRFGSWSYDTKRLDLHFMDGFEVGPGKEKIFAFNT